MPGEKHCQLRSLQSFQIAFPVFTNNVSIGCIGSKSDNEDDKPLILSIF